MNTCTSAHYREYLASFTRPAPADRQVLHEGKVGLIFLPEKYFKYDKDLGYSFELAVLAEEGSGNRLLFVRIDSWDPHYRETAAPGEIDYCIPLAHEGASARERLTWTIPFGGAWSDTKQEALVVFDCTWREWLRSCSEGLAFSNPGAESAAFLKLGERELAELREFCA